MTKTCSIDQCVINDNNISSPHSWTTSVVVSPQLDPVPQRIYPQGQAIGYTGNCCRHALEWITDHLQTDVHVTEP